ncbi:MAG: MJ0042-type zinc finger domain-containing protein [Gemmataceae bacterium]
MADTITLICPECDKQLRVSEDLVGKKVRCKGCDATFVARAPGKSGSKSVKAEPSRDTKAKAPAGKAPAAKAPAAKPKAEPAKPAPIDDPFAADNTPFGVREEYLGRRCPDCANAMEDDDRICLHCGYDTVSRQRARTRKVQEVTGFDVFLWLLPGILCALLVFSILGGLTYYWLAVSRETFGDAWYDFLGGLGMKVYTSVIGVGIIYKAGRFAIIRLCIHYLPPEVELKMGEGK